MILEIEVEVGVRKEVPVKDCMGEWGTAVVFSREISIMKINTATIETVETAGEKFKTTFISGKTLYLDEDPFKKISDLISKKSK